MDKMKFNHDPNSESVYELFDIPVERYRIMYLRMIDYFEFKTQQQTPLQFLEHCVNSDDLSDKEKVCLSYMIGRKMAEFSFTIEHDEGI